MRLRAGIAAGSAALLLADAAGGSSPRPVVVGISWEDVGKLGWLDARTLAPVGRLVLGS